MSSEKVKAAFDRLPFKKLAEKAGEKIPFFEKIIPFANYIGSGLAVILLVGIINLAIPNGPKHTIKYLNSINNDTTRYWVNFIKKNGINAINPDDNTILLAGIKSNNVKLVEACFKDGADPNKQGDIILREARNTNNPEICELCLKNGAKINPEEIIGTDFYDTSLDDVFIPYYKKQKITDFTKKDAYLLTDSSPLRVAKMVDAGFKFSYYDMVVLIMEYLNSSNDETAANVYMNALKNNCDHKAFLTEGVYCTDWDKEFNFAHEIITYLKIIANNIYTAENIEMVIDNIDYSGRYTMKFIGAPLYDIYTSNPNYKNQDINIYYNAKYSSGITFGYMEDKDVAYLHLSRMSDNLYPMFNRNHPGSILSKWKVVSISPSYVLSRIYDEYSLNEAKEELKAFYSKAEVQKQKNQLKLVIEFLESQGY